MAGEEKATNARTPLRILHDSDTNLGRVIFRQRWSLALERDVFEMTLDGKLMMSSAVVDSERALADRALALLPCDILRRLSSSAAKSRIMPRFRRIPPAELHGSAAPEVPAGRRSTGSVRNSRYGTPDNRANAANDIRRG
jgi:hypothetical protein